MCWRRAQLGSDDVSRKVSVRVWHAGIDSKAGGRKTVIYRVESLHRCPVYLCSVRPTLSLSFHLFIPPLFSPSHCFSDPSIFSHLVRFGEDKSHTFSHGCSWSRLQFRVANFSPGIDESGRTHFVECHTHPESLRSVGDPPHFLTTSVASMSTCERAQTNLRSEKENV